MKPRLPSNLNVGLGLFLLATNATAASLTAIGVPPPAISVTVHARAVTSDGRYVVGYANLGSGDVAFRWSEAEGMIELGELPGGSIRSEAYGVSADGGIVVGVSDAEGGLALEPFRWTAAGGLKLLGGGLPAGFLGGGALGITPDGQIVVGWLQPASGTTRGYRWSVDGGYTFLGASPDGESGVVPQLVSADGRTVAGYLDRGFSGIEGFRWTEQTGVVGLGREIGGKQVQSEVYGMSADGRFITGLVLHEETRNIEMMRWSADRGMVPLGHFPKGESRSIGYGISDDGQMIVGEAAMEVMVPGIPVPLALPRAAVWREGSGLKPLWDVLAEAGVNPAADGWEFLFEALAVSGDGRFVVGAGRRKGRGEAFLADLSLKLDFAPTEGGLRLSWPASFKLQRTGSLNPATWEDVADAGSPWEITADGQLGFFRVVSAP